MLTIFDRNLILNIVTTQTHCDTVETPLAANLIFTSKLVEKSDGFLTVFFMRIN